MSEITITMPDDLIDRIASAVAAKLQNSETKQSIYTIQELMGKLHLSRNTITDRIRRGDFGEVINDGRRYRVTSTGLQTYIDKHSGQLPRKDTGKVRIHQNPGRI